MEISLNLMGFADFNDFLGFTEFIDGFYKDMLTSLISFSSFNLLLKALFRLKIMSFYNCFFVTNRIVSETSHKLPN